MSQPLLELHDVTKRFGGVTANDRVSLVVNHGEIVGLIGPNGSGKSTLFNSIVGQHSLDAGDIVFQNIAITGLGVARSARLGLMRTFQHTRIYSGMTCIENLLASLPEQHFRLGQLMKRLPSSSHLKALEMLDFVGMVNMQATLAGDLSFGQKRLLELAMLLMSDPKLLLLDEPTAGINPTMINSVVERLRMVRSEKRIAILVIEHNMPVIMGLAERIYCLNRGQILAEGSPEAIRRDQKVIDAYMGAR